MPKDYEAVRNSCYANKKKSKGGKALTVKEKDACKTMAAKWWVKKHGKAFPKEEGSINEQSLCELSAFIVDDSFWENNLSEGVVWGRVTNDKLSYDAVSSIFDKLNMSGDMIRINQTESSRYNKFKFQHVDEVLAVVGINEESEEIQSYVFGENWDLKSAIEWIASKGGRVESESVEWADNKEVSEIFEHKLDYGLVGEARILDINDIDKEVLASAGITNLDKDLMALEFKLVHTNTNANRDEFLQEEVFSAKSTPTYKPVNWQHTDRIIGVMIDSEYMEGQAVAEGEEVEDDFLKIQGVIYKWKFPTYATAIQKRHDEGNLLFSMETWFEEAECSVCAGRFKKVADYCEHLKGRKLEGSTVSRKLIGLTFSGAGVVDNPADKKASSISVANEENNEEDINMPNTGNEVVFGSQEELDIYVEAEKKKVRDEIEAQNGHKELEDKYEQAQTTIQELKDQITAKEEEIQTANDAKDKAEKDLADYKADQEKDKVLANRMSELSDAGVKMTEDEDKLAKVTASIREMDEESWESYKELLVSNASKEEKPEGEEKNKEEANEDEPLPNPAEGEEKDSSALRNIMLKTGLDNKDQSN